MATEQFCLRWNDFHANITAAFSEIKEDEDFLDVTLVSTNKQKMPQMARRNISTVHISKTSADKEDEFDTNMWGRYTAVAESVNDPQI